MEDTFALDGGTKRTVWQKRHRKYKANAARNKAKRAAYDQRCARYDREARRKARIAAVEKVERAAWRKARKADGYTKPGVPYKDITGQRFGLLVVVRPGGHLKSGSKRWWVKCDCGSPQKEVSGTNLKQGLLRSCGFWCTGHPQKQWHKPEVAKRWAAKRKAQEAIRAVPVSLKFLQYCRAKSRTPEESALLRKVRALVVWAEIAQGLVWSRDGKKPAYSRSSLDLTQT